MADEQRESHLLVIKGDDDYSDFIGFLKQQAFRVSVLGDAESALNLLAECDTENEGEREVDLIFLATQIPGMQGVRLVEKIKNNPALDRIPIVMISNGKEETEIAECLKLGADDYIRAPFAPALLKMRIDNCLEKRRLKSQEAHQKNLLKFERDMQIARKIQQDFLPPKLPEPSGWEIDARFKPARQVGGDFYDGFSLPGDRIGLVIADVCDKGVGAALFMALFRSLIRAFADQHRPLGWMGSITEGDSLSTQKKGDSKRRRLLLSAGTGALLAVELTNNYIAQNHGETGMFATLFFGVLDPNTGILTYVNGGHDAPAIISPQGTVKERLMPTGPAVGAMPDMFYDVRQVTIAPGDLLIAFTDGVTDALSPQDKRFSEEGLFSLLTKRPGSCASPLLDSIEAALQDHIAEADQFDDITMLVARRTGLD